MDNPNNQSDTNPPAAPSLSDLSSNNQAPASQQLDAAPLSASAVQMPPPPDMPAVPPPGDLPPSSPPVQKNPGSKKILIFAITLIFISVIFALTVLMRYTRYTTKNEATSTPTATPTKPQPTPSACSLQDTNIVLVIDRSSTMNANESDGRKKLDWAKQSAKTLVTRISSMKDVNARISVVSFGAQGNDGSGSLSADNNSTVHISLSSNFASVQSAIDSVKYIKPGTCIECGLRIANSQLAATALNRIVILLSDGKANHNWAGGSANSSGAISQANTGRSSGIIYYVLGYGVGSGIDETTLKAIAGKTANYQYKPNVQEWPEAFLKIVDIICTLPTATPTQAPTKTPTPIPSKTPTPTNTPIPTKTPTPSKTPTPVPSATITPTPIISFTPTPTMCVKPNAVKNIKVSCPACQ